MNVILNFIWKYKELFLIGAIALYLWYVFEDRASLRNEVVDLKAEVVQLGKQQTLNAEITKAIQNIKVQSVNYVSAVEASTPPASSGNSVLIYGGLFNPAVYKTNSTTDTAPSVTKD